jgi:hypothetical protein
MHIDVFLNALTTPMRLSAIKEENKEKIAELVKRAHKKKDADDKHIMWRDTEGKVKYIICTTLETPLNIPVYMP